MNISIAAVPQARNVKARHSSGGGTEVNGRVPNRDDTFGNVMYNLDASPWIVNSGRVAHKYANILVHYVFSTKQRRDLIPAEVLPRLWKYFAGIGRNHKIPVLAAGGMPNHCHLLIALPANVPVAKAIQVLKANSSRWLRDRGLEFAWQEGYGAFSVSSSNVGAVKNYIKHQAEHHARRTYEEEFEVLVRKSGMGFDEREAFG